MLARRQRNSAYLQDRHDCTYLHHVSERNKSVRSCLQYNRGNTGCIGSPSDILYACEPRNLSILLVSIESRPFRREEVTILAPGQSSDHDHCMIQAQVGTCHWLAPRCTLPWSGHVTYRPDLSEGCPLHHSMFSTYLGPSKGFYNH